MIKNPLDPLSLDDIITKSPWADVRAFGATGDGVTDDAAAINSAAQHCRDNNKVLRFPSSDGYLIGSQVDLQAINFKMDSAVIVGFDGVGILCGGSTLNFEIRVESSSNRWDTAGTVGVKILNPKGCFITFRVVGGYSKGFEKGVLLSGATSGAAYNIFTMERLQDNKYGLYITDENASGWVNENVFLNGRFTVRDVGNGDRAGVVTDQIGTATFNNNIWIKPCFEMVGAGDGSDRFGFIFDSAQRNLVILARNEPVDYVAKFTGTAQYNRIEVGYGTNSYIDESSYKGNYVYLFTDRHKERIQILDTTTFMHAWTDDNGDVHVPGFSIRYLTNSNVYNAYSSGAHKLILYKDYIYADAYLAIGIRIDTTTQKRFFVNQEIYGSVPGLLYVKCFDANGNHLGGTSPYYLQQVDSAYAVNYHVTYFGGAYYMSAVTVQYELHFHADVKSAWIGFSGGGKKFSGMSIYAIGEKVKTWLDYDGLKEYSPYKFSGGEPTEGTFNKGTQLQSNAPSTGVTPGWVCTASGTMGTLAATTGDTVNGKNILTDLSQLVGLEVGVYLDVAGAYAGGDDYITKTIAAVASTTVDAVSGVSEANKKLLNVTATTGFVVGETIIIDRGTNNEVRVIASIQAGVSLTLTEDMTNDYTNEAVENCVVMNGNAGATVNDATVTHHAATWADMAVLDLPAGIDYYVDRGDPAAYDFVLGDLTTDYTWRDLDLSSIIPAGATAAHITVTILDDAASSSFQVRKNGNSNAYNSLLIRTAVANVAFDGEGIVSLDANRVVEYRATNTTWTAINIVIKGWWIP